MTKLNKNRISMIALVVLLLLFTGELRLMIVNGENHRINVVFTLMIFTIYVGMLSVWAMSIWRRVMHAHIRGYLMGVVGLMLFWIFVRTLRDPHFNYIDPVNRWLWYCYYISLILIPLLSFFAALCLGKPENWRPSGKSHLLFIPATVLILGILTNDLHQLAFGFPLGIERGDSYYRHHILYYLAVVWIAGFFIVLVWLLFKKSYILHTKKKVWMPLAIIGTGLIYTVLYAIDDSTNRFGFIEITAMLCTLTAGIWESCIQNGLLLSNSKHEDFFDESSLGAQIVAENGTVYYDSKLSQPIAPHSFAELKKVGFLKLDLNTQLHASPIQGGYIIWREDISRTSLLMSELENTKTELMDDLDLLKNELKVRQRRLRIDEQNHLYDLTVREILPQIEQIKEYLALEPQVDELEKYKLLWHINILGAYIKRRTNLILMAVGQETVTVKDLARCLEESFENLESGGVAAALSIDTTCDITPQNAVLLYDFFEAVVESVLSKLHSLSITISDGGKELTMIIELKSDVEQVSFPDENWKKEELDSSRGRILFKAKDEEIFSFEMYLLKGGGGR